MKRIAVVCGGWSSEAEISRKGAEAVAAALKRLGFETYLLELTPDIAVRLLELKPDLVFPLLHGKPGEDGTFQGFLEIMGIPYIGEGVKVSSICMDKDWTKRLLSWSGIEVPEGIAVRNLQDPLLERWNSFPAVVKPAEGGSSIGLKIAPHKDELLKAVEVLLKVEKKVLVEKVVGEREYTCGFLVGQVLTPLEIKAQSGIYDFETKYTKGAAEFFPVKGELGRRIKDLTLEVVRSLEIQHLCRVDFRYDPHRDRLYVLEVNTIPGMTETSLLPTMAKFEGISFDRLVWLLISAKATGG